MMQGPGPWGGVEPRRGGGGAAQHRAGPACATKRSVSLAAGVPQRLPAHGQGGGSQPSREQTSPGEQTLTGFLYFRKAASATCPFLTPTQVGHPATSPCPALPCPGRRSGTGLAHSAWSPSPASLSGEMSWVLCGLQAPWLLWKEVSGQRDPRFLVFAPAEGPPAPGLSPSPGLACVASLFSVPGRLSQATRRSCHPPSGLPRCPRCGAVCARVRVPSLNPEVQGSGHRGLCREMQTLRAGLTMAFADRQRPAPWGPGLPPSTACWQERL